MRRAAPLLALTCVLVLGVVGGAHGAVVSPVASGLDSPRGLAFLPNGTFVVAEAGHGGDVCLPGGFCLGTTGRISTLDPATGSHAPLVAGLFSGTDPEGGALGVDGLSAQGGRLLAIMGVFPQALDGATCAGQPDDCPSVLATAREQAGTLLKVTPNGGRRTLAGVGAFDFQWTVDQAIPGAELDSNPYGLLAQPGGTLVADAGSNTLDRVAANGRVSVIHRFPNPDPPEAFPSDAVPTCVASASDGRLYVGDLAGRIWEMHGSDASLVSGQGGRHYTGCAADAVGDVYFVSMFEGAGGPNPGTGSIVKLAADGTVSTLVSSLVFPNGITVGGDGALYVSVNSVCPATPGGPCGPLTGGVVRVTA